MRRPPQDDAGFSLVEILIALVVFSLLSVGVAAGLANALGLSRNSRNRVVASQLLQARIELLRQAQSDENGAYFLPGHCDASSGCADPAPVNGVAFHLVQDTQWVSLGVTSSPCDGAVGSSQYAYQRVSLTATWNQANGVSAVRANTLFTPHNGLTDAATGSQPIRIRTATNLPEPGIVVTMTPAASGGGASPAQSVTTDESGCALLPFLKPGNYVATTSAAGYTDWAGVQTHNRPFTISIGQQNTTQEWQYDKPAQVTINTVLENGSLTKAADPVNGYAPAVGIGATGYNVNRSASGLAATGEDPNAAVIPGTLPVAKTLGASTGCDTTTCLFPFPTGYQVWGSNCTPGDPAVYGAPRTVTVAPAPGATVTASVVEKPAVFQVRRFGLLGAWTTYPSALGTAYQGVAVYAVHKPTSDCSGPGVADPLTGATVGEAYYLGTTDAAGSLRAAIPYGSWSFEYKTPSAATFTDYVSPDLAPHNTPLVLQPGTPSSYPSSAVLLP